MRVRVRSRNSWIGAGGTKPPAKLEDTGTALLSVDGQHVGEVVSTLESKIADRLLGGLLDQLDVALDDDEGPAGGDEQRVERSVPPQVGHFRAGGR